MSWLLRAFRCHGISRHRWGGLAARESRRSPCRRGPTRPPWWLPASSGHNARGSGATGGGLGVLRVGGAFVQYAQPSASRSPPSCSIPTLRRPGSEPTSNYRAYPSMSSRAGGGRAGAGVELPAGVCVGTRRGPAGQRPGGADEAGPGVRAPALRHQDPGGGGHVGSLVSTQRTSAASPSMRPVGIVGMLRFLLGVRNLCGADVSAMDTDSPPGLLYRPTVSPSPGARPSMCLGGPHTHMP